MARQGLFHNGDPVTSEDVRYSIEQMAGEKSTAYLKGDMQPIVKIQTPDARTVRLTTKEPTVVLPNLFASASAFIVAKGSVDNNGPGIGAGPFMLAGQERGTYVDLVAFDRFYVPGLSLALVISPEWAVENSPIGSGVGLTSTLWGAARH